MVEISDLQAYQNEVKLLVREIAATADELAFYKYNAAYFMHFYNTDEKRPPNVKEHDENVKELEFQYIEERSELNG